MYMENNKAETWLRWLAVVIPSIVLVAGAIWWMMDASINKLRLQLYEDREPMSTAVSGVQKNVGELTGQMDIALRQLQSLQANYKSVNNNLTTLENRVLRIEDRFNAQSAAASEIDLPPPRDKTAKVPSSTSTVIQ